MQGETIYNQNRDFSKSIFSTPTRRISALMIDESKIRRNERNTWEFRIKKPWVESWMSGIRTGETKRGEPSEDLVMRWSASSARRRGGERCGGDAIRRRSQGKYPNYNIILIIYLTVFFKTFSEGCMYFRKSFFRKDLPLESVCILKFPSLLHMGHILQLALDQHQWYTIDSLIPGYYLHAQ